MLATLTRVLGDFDLAEEALHEAFASAVERWPRTECLIIRWPGWYRRGDLGGRCDSPPCVIRCLAWRSGKTTQTTAAADDALDGEVEDDRLRLIFTCCHPALPPDAQVALTLREVCGLTTEEIAHAFLSTVPTIAQRIVRAKAKIKSAKIPYQIPSQADLPDRLDAVLRVGLSDFQRRLLGLVG